VAFYFPTFFHTMAETGGAKQEEVAPTGTELYIGNLAWAVSAEDLTKAFAEFGELADARIVMSARTGQSKGFGFVTFNDKDAATKALAEMDEKDFVGAHLTSSLPGTGRWDLQLQQDRRNCAKIASISEISRRSSRRRT